MSLLTEGARVKLEVQHDISFKCCKRQMSFSEFLMCYGNVVSDNASFWFDSFQREQYGNAIVMYFHGVEFAKLLL